MTQSSEKQTTIQYFLRIIRELPTRQQRLFCLLLMGMLVMACLETSAAGAIAFFVAVVSSPDTVMNSGYLQYFRDILGLDWLTSARNCLLFSGVGAAILVVLKNVFRIGLNYYSQWFGAVVDAVYGNLFLSVFLSKPYEWYLSKNSADLILAIEWRTYFGRIFCRSVVIFLADVTMVLVMLSTVIVINPTFFLGSMGVIGIASAVILELSRVYIDRNSKRIRENREFLNRSASMALHGFKDVKISGKERYFLDAFSKTMNKVSELFAVQGALVSSPAQLLESIGFVGMLGVVAVWTLYADASSVRVTGSVALLAVVAWRILPSVTRIVSSVTQFRTAYPYLEKGFRLLDEASLVRDAAPVEATPPGKAVFTRDLVLKGVEFQYQTAEAPALMDIDLSIRRGDCVGIIGPSGAGKSTLVDIIIGLLSPTCGTVELDGRPFDGAVRAAWMSCVGYVPQSPYIADGTIQENVAFGVPAADINPKRVNESCEMASMDFIANLPQGLDTPIGERGVKLSGGQRQRIAIARALYEDPQVMIFDEATSALDDTNEKAIQQTVSKLRNDRTQIIIAHRLTSVMDCDYLIWLEEGRIVEVGATESVLRKYSAVKVG